MNFPRCRRRLLFRILSALWPAIPCMAQSPAGLLLLEDGLTRIECRWNRDEALPGFDPSKGPQKGTWHYDAWVPKGFAAHPERRYPCLFISSPVGEAKNFLPLYKDWLAKNEWVAVMLTESRNGPIEPCLGNFLSAHDDAVQRLRIIDTMKAAAGMSGAARMSSLYAQVRPGFRGLFLQGAGFSQSTLGRYWMKKMPPEGTLAVFLTLGKKDSNLVERGSLLNALSPGVPYYPRLFDGGHITPPPEIAAEGMDWLAHHMWLSAAGEKPVRAQASATVKRLAERVALTSSPAERYALLTEAGDLVKAFGLASHPEIAPLMSGFSRDFADLKKDPSIQLEIRAAAVLETMRERQKRTAMQASKLTDATAVKALWGKFCVDCETAAAPFSQTAAGKECRLLAEGLAP